MSKDNFLNKNKENSTENDSTDDSSEEGNTDDTKSSTKDKLSNGENDKNVVNWKTNSSNDKTINQPQVVRPKTRHHLIDIHGLALFVRQATRCLQCCHANCLSLMGNISCQSPPSVSRITIKCSKCNFLLYQDLKKNDTSNKIPSKKLSKSLLTNDSKKMVSPNKTVVSQAFSSCSNKSITKSSILTNAYMAVNNIKKFDQFLRPSSQTNLIQNSNTSYCKGKFLSKTKDTAKMSTKSTLNVPWEHVWLPEKSIKEEIDSSDKILLNNDDPIDASSIPLTTPTELKFNSNTKNLKKVNYVKPVSAKSLYDYKNNFSLPSYSSAEKIILDDTAETFSDKNYSSESLVSDTESEICCKNHKYKTSIPSLLKASEEDKDKSSKTNDSANEIEKVSINKNVSENLTIPVKNLVKLFQLCQVYPSKITAQKFKCKSAKSPALIKEEAEFLCHKNQISENYLNNENLIEHQTSKRVTEKIKLKDAKFLTKLLNLTESLKLELLEKAREINNEDTSKDNKQNSKKIFVKEFLKKEIIKTDSEFQKCIKSDKIDSPILNEKYLSLKCEADQQTKRKFNEDSNEETPKDKFLKCECRHLKLGPFSTNHLDISDKFDSEEHVQTYRFHDLLSSESDTDE